MYSTSAGNEGRRRIMKACEKSMGIGEGGKEGRIKDRGMTYIKSSLLPRFLTERTTQLNIIEEYKDCALHTKNHLQHS